MWSIRVLHGGVDSGVARRRLALVRREGVGVSRVRGRSHGVSKRKPTSLVARMAPTANETFILPTLTGCDSESDVRMRTPDGVDEARYPGRGPYWRGPHPTAYEWGTSPSWGAARDRGTPPVHTGGQTNGHTTQSTPFDGATGGSLVRQCHVSSSISITHWRISENASRVLRGLISRRCTPRRATSVVLFGLRGNSSL
jgi:hypothetical protein